MWRLTGLVASVFLLVSCGTGQIDEPETTSTSDSLPSDDGARIEEACGAVLEGLLENNTALIVPSLEDLDAILSIVGPPGLRSHIHVATDALPTFADTPPSKADLAEAAPSLIELSNGLIAAGAEGDCAGIGELAAGFETQIVDRDSMAQRLAEARETWAGAAVSSYSLELSPGPVDGFDVGCGTGGAILVEVVDDRLEGAIDRISGCRIELDEGDRIPLTIEELFALVDDHLDAEVLEVDFEPQLGYPRMIFIRDESGITELSVMSFHPGETDHRMAEAILAELQRQHAAWMRNDIDDYTLEVEIGCFCPEAVRGPFDVTVVDGEIEAVLMDGEVVEPAEKVFLTVEGLFSVIEDYAHSDEIEVTYAPTGHPSTIDIDPDFRTVDEELYIEVHDLLATGD